MVELVKQITSISKKSILLIGDLMLDTYTIGRVKRISPEAPVSILQVEKEEEKPGGAGNVAINLKALGMEPILVGRIGNDLASIKLKSVLEKEGIDSSYLVYEENYKLPLKNRVIAGNQQMMRIDYEEILETKKLEDFLSHIDTLLEKVALVAISDYAKGLLTHELLSEIITRAQAKAIPVIIDPKGSDFSKYKGATIIKPNMHEALQASGLKEGASLNEIAQKILQETEARFLLITRSEEGVSLFSNDTEQQDFPVNVKEVKDVTGAGDTVLAMLATSIANALPLETASVLANLSAGIAIEQLGCAKVSFGALVQRVLQLGIDSKIFDENHLEAFVLALSEKPFVVLSLNLYSSFTYHIYQAIKNLSVSNNGMLVICLSADCENKDFIDLLSSLKEVDFIFKGMQTLSLLSNTLTPSAIYELNSDGAILLGSTLN